MAFPTFLTLNVPGEGYSRNTSCAPNPIYFFDTITWSILRLASSQLTTIIHWPFYCTAHFNVAFHVCDKMWSFRVLANLWSFCYCLFIYVLPLVIQLSRVERARVAQWVRLLDYLTTHTSLSQIRRGFARLCIRQKGCTRLATASDKVYQLLAHGRWFSPGTLASSTTKTGRVI